MTTISEVASMYLDEGSSSNVDEQVRDYLRELRELHNNGDVEISIVEVINKLAEIANDF